MGSNGDGTRTFWTVAIPDNDVTVQFAAGKAEMQVNNLSLDDYHNLPNAIGPNFENPATEDDAVVSFDVVWSGPITRRLNVPDGTLGNNYAGEYVENQVSVTWSGTNLATGFSFTSNPGTFATSFADGGFAELGKERNGIFGPDSADASTLVRSLAASSATPANTSAAFAPMRASPLATSRSDPAPSPAPHSLPLPGAAHAPAGNQWSSDLGGNPFADAI